MNGMTRRELLKGMVVAGVGAVGAGALAGCPAPLQPVAERPAEVSPAEVPTTLRFGMWQSDPGLLRAVQDVMLADFEERNPDVDVRLEMAVWSDYWDKLQVQIAAGNAPDVVWMSGAMFYDLKERDAFHELTPYIEQDQFALEGYWSEPTYRENGKVWAMHFYAMVHALYYNREMFREAGVPEPPTDWNDPGWTWADFREAANAITGESGNGGRQWGVELYNSMEWGWGTFILSNGATVLNEDKTEAVTDSEEFIAAIQFIADLIHEDGASPAPGEPGAALGAGLLDNFQAGRAAMRTGNNSRLPTYMTTTDFDWAPCVPPRAAPDKPRRVYWLENPFCMTKSAEQPEIAWRLLRYIGSSEGQQAIAQGKIGMPALKDLALDPAGDFLNPPPDNLHVFPDALENGFTTDLQFTKQWLRWVTVVQQELDPAFLGEMSAEEACQNAKREIDKVLASI